MGYFAGGSGGGIVIEFLLQKCALLLFVKEWKVQRRAGSVINDI